jgi:hypothetical protein
MSLCRWGGGRDGCCIISRDNACRRPRFPNCTIAQLHHRLVAQQRRDYRNLRSVVPLTYDINIASIPHPRHDNYTHQHHSRPPLISYAASLAVRAQQAQTQSWPQEPRHRRSSTATRLVSGYQHARYAQRHTTDTS